MPKKASSRDAQLIIQLYDLRREAEMRKAREWWTSECWPNSADDFMKVASAPGTQENQWLRQVAGYWGIATSFVLQGALDEDLFLVPGFSGEMFVLFAKVYPSSRNFVRNLATRNLSSISKKSSCARNGAASV
jgi:hypothetical protein